MPLANQASMSSVYIIMQIVLSTFLVYLVYLVQIESKVQFTNIKYKSLDPTFFNFEYCYIKAVNRSYKYVSLKMNLLKIPVQDIHARNVLLRRANGYKPFLYNITYDVCKFMKTPSNMVVKYFFSFINGYTNLNHSCPYNHDILILKVPISHFEHLTTKILPMPEGDYGLFATYSSLGIARGEVKLFFTI